MMHGASEFRHAGTGWHRESLARLTPKQSMPAEVKDNCVDDFCTSEASVLMQYCGCLSFRLANLRGIDRLPLI